MRPNTAFAIETLYILTQILPVHGELQTCGGFVEGQHHWQRVAWLGFADLVNNFCTGLVHAGDSAISIKTSNQYAQVQMTIQPSTRIFASVKSNRIES